MSDLSQYISGGFNADEAAAEAPKGGNVPDGEYYFTISAEKVETSEDSEYVESGRVRVCITMDIQADLENNTALSGRKVFDDYWILHEDPKMLGTSKSYFGKLVVATLGTGYIVNKSKELLTGQPFVAELKTKRGKNGKDYQNMVNPRSVDEANAEPAKTAPSPTPVAAPAATAPVKKKMPWE